MFLLISTHFTATLGIPPTSTSLKTCSFKRRYRLSRYISRLTCLPAYAPFTPSNSGQRLPPTYYRGCWHVVSRGFLLGYLLVSSPKTEVYNPEDRLPSRGVAASGFPPLCNIPHCCLPQESGPCLSPNVAVRPLSPATDRRLGRPLPHQLSNRTRAHLSAIKSLITEPCDSAMSCGISDRFQSLSPSDRQVAHVLLTRPPLSLQASIRKLPPVISVRLACVRRAASVRPEP